MTAKLRKLFQGSIIALMLTSMAYGATGNHSLALLLPDGCAVNDVKVQVWLEAAKEEGFSIRTIYDSEFIAAGKKAGEFSGIILPDHVHIRASDALVTAIHNYVAEGGSVMLTYDFGLHNDKGFYAAKSRFSTLAGVDYAVGSAKTIFGPIVGMESVMWQLQVPPGKTMDYTGKLSFNLFNPPWIPSGNPTMIAPSSMPQAISSYAYGIINYYSHVTTTDYKGKALLFSPEGGLAAGIINPGKGRVLFVNIPLGYFALMTDAMLLRGFLYYFGVKMLTLPRLSGFPDGRGGLVLNWHCDALEAQEAIEELDKTGVWDRGKFSINFTAGPDETNFGDDLGFDIPNNPVIQNWIKVFMKKGHAIGSHGGWIHNYYGEKASETNDSEFLNYVILNTSTIKAVTQQKALEYSAPQGNNPHWAMSWLQKQGVVAYYYAGDVGSPPRRAFRDGAMGYPKMWAFGVTPFRKYAVWDEFDMHGIPEKDVEKWYYTLMDFVANYRTVRLIYMHPPYAQLHIPVLNSMFDRADIYASRHLFRWYTMAELGQFGNSRLNTVWNIVNQGKGNFRFEATHPVNLETMTWLLPKTKYKNIPVITFGKGEIKSDNDYWLVIAGAGRSLKFTSNIN